MIMREGRQKRKQFGDLGYMFYCFSYILQHLILISLRTLFIMNYFVVVVVRTCTVDDMITYFIVRKLKQPAIN